MALIYAFRDEAGHWHGDPGRTGAAVEATLTFPAGCAGPFAGQTLLVRTAGLVEATPGSIRYFLDDGTTCYATREAENRLFGPQVTAARRHERWPPPAASGDTPAFWALSDGDRHYDLTVTPGPGRSAVEIVGADRDGQVIASLRGHLPDGDLGFVAALLREATGPAPARSRRRGRWSPQEKALAVRRHHEGATVEAIADELSRTPKGVQYKLHYLGLAPLPRPARRRP